MVDRQKRLMSKSVSERLTHALLDMIVLCAIQAEKTHGYQLMKYIKEKYNMNMAPSVIYPLLNQLEKQVYIERTAININSRFRNIYSLTEQGQEKLDQMLTEFKNVSETIASIKK